MGNCSSSSKRRAAEIAEIHEPEPAPTPLRTIPPEQAQYLEASKQDFTDGNELFRAQRPAEATLKYAQALWKLKRYEEYPGNSDDHTEQLSNVGALHFAEGRYVGAKTLIVNAERQRGLLHDAMALHDPCLVSLGIAMRHKVADRSLPPMQRLLIADVNEHTNIDSLTADLCNNLGACYEVRQDLENARLFYRESLRLREVVFGERSLKSAEAMQNMATVLDGQGHAQEALEMLIKALSVEEEIRGVDKLENSVTMNNLAVLKAHLGDLPHAQELLQRTHALRLEGYGPEHELTIAAARNLERVQMAIAEGRHRAAILDTDDVKAT